MDKFRFPVDDTTEEVDDLEYYTDDGWADFDPEEEYDEDEGYDPFEEEEEWEDDGR